MSIIRLIYVAVDPESVSEVAEIWNQECAPLMIRQEGCLSEQLLQCREAPGEYISYSEWQDQESIDRYLASEDHQEIKRHSGKLKRVGTPRVQTYSRVS